VENGAVSDPSTGEAQERRYEAVMHVVSAPTLEVLGDAAHVVGIPTFRGLAIFADGTVVPHRYAGWFDTVDGIGDFRGTALWQWPDGELKATYDGRIETGAGGTFALRARMHAFSGTGRYQGVSGEGSFAGQRFDAVATGGETYLKGTMTLRLVR